MHMKIGEMARSGEWCDICEKMIYLDIWGHMMTHKRQLQQEEDNRASREASERFKESVRRGKRG